MANRNPFNGKTVFTNTLLSNRKTMNVRELTLHSLQERQKSYDEAARVAAKINSESKK